MSTIEGQIPNLVPNTQIGGDALGLVKNGGNVIIASDGSMNAESGDGWETLDLTDLPTDFADGDMLEVEFGIVASGSTLTSWNTPPTTASISGSFNRPIIERINLQDQKLYPNIPLEIASYTQTIVFIRLSGIGSPEDFNNKSNMFTLYCECFNGGGKVGSDPLYINGTNITQYINSIRRKKQN